MKICYLIQVLVSQFWHLWLCYKSENTGGEKSNHYIWTNSSKVHTLFYVKNIILNLFHFTEKSVNGIHSTHHGAFLSSLVYSSYFFKVFISLLTALHDVHAGVQCLYYNIMSFLFHLRYLEDYLIMLLILLISKLGKFIFTE